MISLEKLQYDPILMNTYVEFYTGIANIGSSIIITVSYWIPFV